MTQWVAMFSSALQWCSVMQRCCKQRSLLSLGGNGSRGHDALSCSVLQCVAVVSRTKVATLSRRGRLKRPWRSGLKCVAVGCIVWQRVAVVLLTKATTLSRRGWLKSPWLTPPPGALCRGVCVLQCVAVCCNVLQCVAVFVCVCDLLDRLAFCHGVCVL